MLENEYRYYLENKETFINKYLNKYIVIKQNEILGIYNSVEDAVQTSLIDNELGTFLVQKVKEKEEPARFFNKVFVN